MRVYPWVNPIVFGNNRPSRTTDGENVSTKSVFRLSFSQYVFFWGNKLQKVFGTSFFMERLYSFSSSDAPFPQKWPRPPKNFFAVILENTVFFLFFFRKTWLNKKYSRSHFLQKRLHWFLSPDTPFSSRWSCPRANCSYSQFFPKICFFSKNIFNNKIFGT